MPTELNNAKSIMSYFYKWEKEKANDVYLRQPKGNQWNEYTWKEVGDQARRMVTALQDLGYQKGDHIGIFSKNCYHWFIADIALLMGGYVSVPFYPNLNAEQLGEVLRLSNTKALFLGKLDDWAGAKGGVPDHVQCIKFPHYDGNAKVDRGIEWNNLIQKHEPIQGEPDRDFEDVHTIIYTSGTTGTPKGVMLQYKAPALLMENERVHNTLGIFDGKPHHFISYLPLNHIAEKNIVEMASILVGAQVSFAESLDTFAKNLQDVQPTIFMSVPRLWSKFRIAILEKLPQKKLDKLLKVPILKNVIKNKVKKGLGLSRCRVILTGAAPTPDPLKVWYEQFDLKLQEVYGMTENCAGCTLMPKQDIRSGTVGKALPNVDIKTDPDSGEIIMKNPWMMQGYYNEPEKTNDVIKNGWIYTGDQGHIDQDGYLHITGRVKDTFKSAKGKYIVPAPIEFKFAKNDFIENIAVVGLGVPQPLALVNLSDIGKSAEKSAVTENFKAQLQEVNNNLIAYQKVNSIVVVGEDWSIENNMLTPTMKIKRSELNKKYQSEYNDWYEQQDNIIWL